MAPDRTTVVTPLAAIADAVRGTFDADGEERASRRIRLLDTVDRRLTRRGWRLEVEPVEAGERWHLLARHGRVCATADVPVPSPRLVDDLPDGSLHRALEHRVGIRALIAGPWIVVAEHRAALRDAEGKVRCRLLARTAMVEDSGDRRSTVRVEPLKGYEADAARIADRIAKRYGWAPVTPDPLETLAENLRPGPARDDGLSVTDHAAPAGPALRLVLLALLDELEQRAAGVIADIDCEELHEFRVAIRRSRSILSLLRSADPAPELEWAREFFAWLGRITGPTRDLDVHILDWRAHRRSAAPRETADLEPLGRYLKSERDRALVELVSVLRSRVFRAGTTRWRRALTAGAPAWSVSAKQQMPVGLLARRRIVKLYRRAVAEGSAITADSPVECLHTLRKTMKKLRYVFEIVRKAYPEKPARFVLAQLKELQQVLGDIQDSAVQAEALRNFGEAMGKSGMAGPATLMAIGAQVETLDHRRIEARARFAAVFEPVAQPRFRDRLQRLTQKGDDE